MADEERDRIIEKTLKTLAEIAASHDIRMAALEELVARQDGRAETLENLLSRQDERSATLEKVAAEHQRLLAGHERRVINLNEAFQSLAAMFQRHQEWMAEIRAVQAETGHKLAALVDAQIRAQEAAADSERKIAALAESQTHSDRRLGALIDVVRDLLDGRKPEGGLPSPS
jgi:chromosome segregation ATPase